MFRFRNVASALVLVTAAVAHAAPEFASYGSVVPTVLSGDARSFAGTDYATVYRQTPEGGFVNLGSPTGAYVPDPVAIRGGMVYGTASYNAAPYIDSFRHASGSGFTAVPGLTPGDQVRAVSADGRLLSGYRYEGGEFKNFQIVDGVRREISGILAYRATDSGILLGRVGQDPAWVGTDGVLHGLARPAGAATAYIGVDFGADDGRTFVTGDHVWSEAYGNFRIPTALGTGGVVMTGLTATAISPDGSTIAGLYSFDYLNQSRRGGWIWTKAEGTQDLQRYMASRLPSQPFGGTNDIVSVTDLGFDPSGGLVVTGAISSYKDNYGYNLGFRYGAAPQAVPEPASLLALGVGLVAIARRRHRS